MCDRGSIIFECVLADCEGCGWHIQRSEHPTGREARIRSPEGEATLRYYKTGTLDIQRGPQGKDLKSALETKVGEARGAVEMCHDQALAALGPDVLQFLDPQDQASALSSFALLCAGVPLTDYSAMVMPIAKALEGYAAKLLVRLGLADSARVLTPNWSFGTVWDDPNYKNFLQAKKSDAKHLERIHSELPFTRHSSMHSRPGLSSWVGGRAAAESKICEIANLMRETYQQFKGRV